MNLTVEARFQPVRVARSTIWLGKSVTFRSIPPASGAPGELGGRRPWHDPAQRHGFWVPITQRNVCEPVRYLGVARRTTSGSFPRAPLFLHWRWRETGACYPADPVSNQMVVPGGRGGGPQDVWIGGDAGMIWHWDGESGRSSRRFESGHLRHPWVSPRASSGRSVQAAPSRWNRSYRSSS